jgi:hypothetical protein
MLATLDSHRKVKQKIEDDISFLKEPSMMFYKLTISMMASTKR